MKRAAALLITLSLLGACQQSATAASPNHAVNAPAAVRRASEPTGMQTAVFSGGCFWGTEAVFSHTRGVTSAISGYQGGDKGAANYGQVSAGRNSHAESVKITYDPSKVRYDQLLQIFFSVIADPTTLNRQGPDVGAQYRSALVPLTEEQRLVASAYLAQMKASGKWRGAIVTRIEPNKGFYPAEDHHQDFAAKNPSHPYITYWDVPKIASLRQLFPGLYKPSFTRG